MTLGGGGGGGGGAGLGGRGGRGGRPGQSCFFFLIVSMEERWFFTFLNLLFFLSFASAYLLIYLNDIINDPLSGL